eukprot:2680179-Alexandrium_andersonii.AAC.1
MADCGLRRIGALMGLGRIADCTLGTLRCKGARIRGYVSIYVLGQCMPMRCSVEWWTGQDCECNALDATCCWRVGASRNAPHSQALCGGAP